MVFVAARWPGLVREAVLLGAPPELAAEATTDALSRCRGDWGRTSQEQDVDRLVRDELALAVAKRPRTPQEGREQAAEELLVLAPPTPDDLDAQERANRRQALKRARWPAALVAAALLGAVVYTTASGGDESPPDEDETPAVTREANPAEGVVWWSAGELHLENVVVQVRGLTDMTRVSNGVVYGDQEGRVVFAAEDGDLRELGRKDPDVPVAATDETGLAAWYDPEEQEVHVVEAANGNVRLEAPVDDAPEVVAVDGDLVYLVGEDGARSIQAGSTDAVPVSPADLLDVRSRIRVFQKDPGTIQIVQSAFNVVFEVPGTGADLAPDGNTVATRGPGVDVLVYDTRSGAQLDGRVGGGSQLLAVSLGTRGAVAYVATSGNRAQLRTCVLADQHCQTVDLVEVDPDTVLAR